MSALSGRPIWALASLLVAMSPAWSAEYSIGGRVSAQVGYNDNVDLSTNDENESSSGRLAGEVNLLVRSPAAEFGIDGAADILRYENASESDTDSQLVRAFARGETRRSSYGLEGSFRRDSDIVDQFDASGRELDDRRRETLRIAPSFAHQLTRRDQLVADASFQRRTYSDDTSVDSNFWNGTVGLRRQETRRTTLGGQFNTGFFDSDDEESLQLSPQLFVGYALQDRIDVSLSIGPSWVRTEQTFQTPAGRRTDTTNDFGFAINGSLDWQATATTTVALTLFRGLDQGGDGGEAVERTRLNLGTNTRLTRRLRLSLDAAAQRRRSMADNGGEDVDDLQIGPRLRYELTPSTELSIGYRWRYRDRDDSGDAMSNAVFFRVAYAIPTLRDSW